MANIQKWTKKNFSGLLRNDRQSFGHNGLPLARLSKALIASSLVFLKGMIKSGANLPDNLLCLDSK